MYKNLSLFGKKKCYHKYILKISPDLFSQDAKNSSIVYTDAIIFLQNVMKEVLIKETNTPKKSPKKLRTSQGKNKNQ